MTSASHAAAQSLRDVHDDVIVLHNAKIWQSGSLDADWLTFSRATGLIGHVGRGPLPAGLNALDPAGGQRLDLGGRRVLPGLHESHLHVASYGKLLCSLDVKGCHSIEELTERIASYAAANPEMRWIVGRGWEHDLIGRYPTRHDLDAGCRDRPVFLLRICGHAAVVNSVALELAGITAETPDPETGGSLVREEPPSRAPTGLLLEKAIDLIKSVVPPATSNEKVSMIESSLAVLLRHGVTSAHACEEETWNEFCQLADSDRLPLRVFFSAYYRPPPTPSGRENSEAEVSGSGGGGRGNFPGAGETRGRLLSCDRIKLFADGALGASTAALSVPYCGSRCDHGVLMQTQEDLTARIHEATSSGYRLEIHVIGDRATEVVLDALDAVPVAAEKRPILTHCQILRADLVERMRARGVVANIQPQFVPTDARWLPEKLPPQLLSHAYAWKTLLDSGVPCAGGSDAPVEAPEPLVGMYDSIYRRYGTGEPETRPVFRPEECLTVQQAIDLYTRGGAYATMKEAELGQLLPGYQADFIVLDTDVCANPSALCTARVEQVWVAGQRRL